MALKSFKDFNRLVDKTYRQNSVNYQTNFSALMMGSIVAGTPIDQGYAKGNWHVSDTNSVVVPSKIKDTTRGSARATAKAFKELPENALPSLGRVVYIKNGVRGADGNGYIIGLENGKSMQAPMGMVKLNIVGRSNAISKKARKSI